MRRRKTRTKRSKQRQCSYGLDVEQVVLCVWESEDYVCAKPTDQEPRPHGKTPGALWRAEAFTPSREQARRPLVRPQWSACCAKTVLGLARLPRKGPERANQVTKGVPRGRIPWDIQEPGHFEVDLVHHGGDSSAGEYAHTVQLIDVTTGWSERVAILGRGQTAMEAAFRHILERLPFPIQELHPDNASRVLQRSPGALLERESGRREAESQSSLSEK